MNTDSHKLIARPGSLDLNGKDQCSQAIASVQWIESLFTWASAHQMEPLLKGDGYDKYLDKYPILVSKVEPKEPEYAATYEDDSGKKQFVYTPQERAKKRLVYEDEVYEYKYQVFLETVTKHKDKVKPRLQSYALLSIRA